MDFSAVITAVLGCYFSGWVFGFCFKAWRRFFETAAS